MGFDKKWYGDRAHARGAEDTGPSELSWGLGQVPPGYENAAPANGGAYVGRSPSMADRRVGLAAARRAATPAT